MSRRSGMLLLAICLSLIAAPAAPGGPPAKPRTDFHGQPMPPGALARCGAALLHNLPRGQAGALALAPDGKLVAVAGLGAPVLYDVATGRPIRRLEGQDVRVRKMTFSADGKLLAAVSWEAVYLWNVATGKQLRWPAQSAQPILAIAISPDGKTLAVQPDRKTIRTVPICLREAATGRLLKTLGHHGLTTDVLRFSADGRTLTSLNEPYEYPDTEGRPPRMVRRSVPGRVIWWDVDSGKKLVARELGGPCPLAPDGRTAALWAKDGRVEIRDLRADRLLRTLDTRDRVALFSPDGKVLATAGKGDVVSLWDVSTGRLRRRFPTRDRDHKANPDWFFVLAALSPGGALLVTRAGTGFHGSFSLWDTASGRKLLPPDIHLGAVTCLAFAADGKTLVSGSADRTLRRWEAASGKPLGLLSGHGAAVTLAALSPDGALLASADADHVLRLWDVRTGRTLSIRSLAPANPTDLAFSPDGKRLEVATVDGRLLVCDPSTGKPVRTFRLRRTTLRPHTLSVDSPFPWRRNLDKPESRLNRVLSLGRETKVPGIDPPLPFEIRTIQCLARSPDGKFVATGEIERQALGAVSFHCFLRVWEVATGKIVLQVETPTGGLMPWNAPSTLVFSSDGRALLAGHSLTPDVHVWNLATGKVVKRLRCHEGPVVSLALSPDDRTLASGSEDSTVLLWDVTRLLPPVREDGRLRLLSVKREWRRLGERNAVAAYRGMWRLVGSPRAAVPLVRDQLRALSTPALSRILRLIADLDNDSFSVRAKATAELEHLGDWAEPALGRALEKPPSLEFRRRAEELLHKIANRPPSSARLQLLRGTAVLERIGTPEGRVALADLARLAPGTALAQEARAALDRLTRNRARR